MKKRILRTLLIVIALVVVIPLLASVFRSTTGIGLDTASENSSKSASEKSRSESTETQSSASRSSEMKNIPHVLREMGDFTSAHNIRRKYILVEPSLDDDVIVDIAQQLHALEPEVWYYLMDNDSDFDAMLKALPETEQSNYENWPYDYVEKHYVGRVMQEIRADGNGSAYRVWLLEGGAARTHLKEPLE